ncbi:hypothetical protein PFLG_00716, partial [Plasmodium falciparum RAJ116]
MYTNLFLNTSKITKLINSCNTSMNPNETNKLYKSKEEEGYNNYIKNQEKNNVVNTIDDLLNKYTNNTSIRKNDEKLGYFKYSMTKPYMLDAKKEITNKLRFDDTSERGRSKYIMNDNIQYKDNNGITINNTTNNNNNNNISNNNNNNNNNNIISNISNYNSRSNSGKRNLYEPQSHSKKKNLIQRNKDYVHYLSKRNSILKNEML